MRIHRLASPLIVTLSFVACGHPAGVNEPPVSAAVPHSQPASPKAEALSLRFAWPNGARARVTYLRQAGGVENRLAYTLSSDSTPGSPGHRIRTLQVEDSPLPEDKNTMTAMMERFELSDKQISAEGELVELVEFDRTFAEIRAAVAASDLSASQRAMLARALESQEIKTTSQLTAAETWQTWVGYWAGLDLPLEAEYVLEAPVQAMGATATITMAYRVLAVDGERATLELRSQYDSATTKRLIHDIMRKMLPSLSPEALEKMMGKGDYAIDTTITLTTSPATLQPSRVIYERLVVLPLSGNRVERRVHKEWHFDWTPPGATDRASERGPAGRPERKGRG